MGRLGKRGLVPYRTPPNKEGVEGFGCYRRPLPAVQLGLSRAKAGEDDERAKS